MKLNHHASQYIFWHRDNSREVFFLFDRKDPKFMPEADVGGGIIGMQFGVNGIGGNCFFGKDKDESPEETGIRELREEFWLQEEQEENLERLIGASSDGTGSKRDAKIVRQNIGAIRDIGIRLSEEPYTLFSGNFRLYFPEGALAPGRPELAVGVTMFSRELKKDEYNSLSKFLKITGNKISPDNINRGSTFEFIPLSRLNGHDVKSSYGHHNLLNIVLDQDKIPVGTRRFTQPKGRIEVTPFSSHIIPPKEIIDITLLGGPVVVRSPTYASLQAAGVEYKDHSQK